MSRHFGTMWYVSEQAHVAKNEIDTASCAIGATQKTKAIFFLPHSLLVHPI